MSTWFWTALLSNTLIAAVLGVGGWLLAHPLRRPALAHTLFVLALLKLVTPPLFVIDVWPATAPTNGLVTIQTAGESQPETAPAGATGPRGSGPRTIEPLAAAASREIGNSVPPHVDGPFVVDLESLAVGVWLLGSVSVGVLLLRRIRRFRHALRSARTADAGLLAEVQTARQRVGLRRAPRVLVCDAGMPPLVFASLRGAVLLVPAAIVGQLERTARTALWSHELAHVRRGDIWLRWFETAVHVALWWHPLCWWLSRQLHDAEERACDASATAGLTPTQRRDYCDALLSVASDCATPVPIPASPAVRHLGRRLSGWQRRLEDVMTREHAVGSRPLGRFAVSLLAVVALPLALAQQPADLATTVTARLDRTEITFRSDEEPLEAWAARLADLAGLHIVVDASATAADRDVTTLRDLQLPKASLRRVLDVIAALTDVGWCQEGDRIVLRARTAANGAARTKVQAPGLAQNGIRCHGAFLEPGLVELRTEETVLSLLARMPLTEQADLGAVRLVRPSGAEALTLLLDVDGMLRTGVTTHDVMLAPGDALVVPERLPPELPPLTLRPGARVRFVIDPLVLQQPGAEPLAALTEFQRVQRDGTIFVPLIGPVAVDGLLRDEVGQLVQRRLLETLKFEVQLWARLD